MGRLLKTIKKMIKKVDTKDNPTPISDITVTEEIKGNNIEVTKSKNENAQNRNVTRYAYGDSRKIRTVEDLEDYRRKQNEINREEYVRKVKELSNSINPRTGKKYTYREIGLVMSCSRTTVGNILNNRSTGKYASIRINENTIL